MLGSGVAMWQICCRIVVSLSVGGVVQHVRIAGVRVVEFGTPLGTPLHGHRLRTCCTTPPTDKKSFLLFGLQTIAQNVIKLE